MSAIDPAQLQQLQQIQQAGQPVTAQTPQAPDPLAAQADALSKQIATMLIQQKPTFGQALQQGVHQAGIAGLAQGTGGNAAQAVNADLERQQQGQQNAVQNRVQLLNQIRQQQNEVAQRGQEQQKIGISQGQLDSMNAERKSTEAYRQAETDRLNKQVNAPLVLKEGEVAVVLDKDGNEVRRISGTPKPAAKVAPPSVKYDAGVPVSVTRGSDEFVIGDPNMPPELKPLGDAAVGAHKQRLQEQANIADDLNKKQEARAEAASARQEAIKNSTAPDDTKKLISSGYLLKDTLSDARDLMAKYPDIVGPAIGRMEQAFQGVGTSFGMESPEKEKAAAQLAKNLVDLTINETRAASQGRTSKELLQLVQGTSASLKQNPNMMSGFLAGADQSAARAINLGTKWGITPGGAPAASGGAGPKPAAQGGGAKPAPVGTVLSDGRVKQADGTWKKPNQ